MANPNAQDRDITRSLLSFGLLAIAEWIFFFRNSGHFFNGDTLFWLWNRHHTVSEFFSGFLTVDPALWYRPLTQRSIDSVLYPIAGLHPIPYRLVGFVLFFSCTVLLWIFAKQLTNRRAAWFATILFAPHVIHAFITYDVAFTPDLVLMFFSVGAAIAYTSFLRTKNWSALILSMLCVIGSLLSKEAAAGLPFALLALWLCAPKETRGSIYSLLPAFSILFVYLVVALGYLHVRGLQVGHILGQIPQDPTSEYRLGTIRNVWQNGIEAFTWAFGIPSGIHGQWFFGADWILPLLKILQLLGITGAVLLLFTKQRRIVLLGLLWFVAMLAAALPLETHFLPYYLFAPLAGLALAGGAIIDWVYMRLHRIDARVAIAISVAVLMLWTKANINASNRLVLTHSLLGASSRHAALALEEVRRAYPTLPRGATLIFLNQNLPAAFGDHGKGKLFNLAYDDPALEVLYYPSGLPQIVDAKDVFTFRWQDGHFVDVTPLMRRTSSAQR